jgi:hypothetical protein
MQRKVLPAYGISGKPPGQERRMISVPLLAASVREPLINSAAVWRRLSRYLPRSYFSTYIQ